MNTRKIQLTAALAGLLLGASTVVSAAHPNPEPLPGFSTQTDLPDGITTIVNSPEGLRPIGDNELPYIESNNFDSNGEEMPNTLPSTPSNMFNLHDGPVIQTPISKTSPTDDLQAVLNTVRSDAANGTVNQAQIQFGLDILEGNPIDRVYSGFALLHYTGPERIKAVTPIFDAAGNKIGGNVDVHQIWYDNHIESDTFALDPTQVQDVPWTVTYTVDVLTGGADDFSPFTMYFDAPPTPDAFVTQHMHGMPNVAMDTSFFPMGDGTRYTIKVKHSLGKYYNLTYTWGWRIHPPRVQAMENTLKMVGPKLLPQWEIDVFGPAPRSSEATKLAAIAQIGELSPAKRMWQALRDARTASAAQVTLLMDDAQVSFRDWSDRRALPRGVTADPNADVTLFYVNNTIYGNVRTFNNWTGRGSVFKATLFNGDHFPHGYMNVDFGGSRGWENQFQFGGGPGGSFTFGRAYWWPTAGGPNGPIVVPPVQADGTPSTHKVEITLNFDSPDRITLYNFDPFHHEVAVYSLH